MKKIFALILAVMMIMSLSVTAFAAEDSATMEGNLSSHDIAVKGTYEAGSTQRVVSADIEWGAMEFTYKAASAGTWDPATHSYKDETPAGWTQTGNTVKVTNHSNTAVAVKYNFSKDASVTTDLTPKFEFDTTNATASGNSSVAVDGASGDCIARIDAPAVGSDYDTAYSVGMTLTLEGSLPETLAENSTIGTITLSISIVA